MAATLMKLPLAQNAYVDASKVRDYLLSSEHPVAVIKPCSSLASAIIVLIGDVFVETSRELQSAELQS